MSFDDNKPLVTPDPFAGMEAIEEDFDAMFGDLPEDEQVAALIEMIEENVERQKEVDDVLRKLGGVEWLVEHDWARIRHYEVEYEDVARRLYAKLEELGYEGGREEGQLDAEEMIAQRREMFVAYRMEELRQGREVALMPRDLDVVFEDVELEVVEDENRAER